MRKKYLLFLFIITVLGCSNNQFLPNRNLHIKIENSEQFNSYQNDFIYLIKVLEDSHPNIYENFPKKVFDAEKNKLLEEFRNIENEAAFQIKLQQFVAKINDAHTKVNITHLFSSNEKYPVSLRWIKDKLYLVNVSQKLPEQYIGCEIIKFGEFSIDKVIKKCGSVISAENDIWQKSRLRRFLRNPTFLEMMEVSNSADSLNMTILTKQQEKLLILYPQEKINWRDSNVRNKITAKKDKPHYYKIFPKENICYYQFNSFYDRKTLKNLAKYYLKWYLRLIVNFFINFKYPDYNNFLNQMFKEIEENGVNKIIVDLRYNGGGNSSLGELFMYYCNMPKTIDDYTTSAIKISELYRQTYKERFEYKKNKFKKEHPDKVFEIPKLIEFDTKEKDNNYSFFKNFEAGNSVWKIDKIEHKYEGKIILLIGPNTFSSASMFATILSDNQQATLIGEPIGQKPTSFGDILLFKLPETNTRVSTSHKVFQVLSRNEWVA